MMHDLTAAALFPGICWMLEGSKGALSLFLAAVQPRDIFYMLVGRYSVSWCKRIRTRYLNMFIRRCVLYSE